jgi:hypothetical protein
MQLPPCIQHLYKHLVGRYGKQGAYRVAVGVVKVEGRVNPGAGTHEDSSGRAGRRRGGIAEWGRVRPEPTRSPEPE